MLITLGLIPILILIHALKPKPTQIEVTNLFLWQEVLKEKSRHLTLKRLIKNLPLLLQIIIVILAALALAKPIWFYFITKKGDMVLVVDTSASMKTKRESGIRLDAAKQNAIDLIDRHGENQKILIVEAGSEPLLKSGFTKNKRRAKALIKQLEASDVPGSLEKAVYLAASFTDPSTEDHIYLITDGAGSDFSTIIKSHPKIIPILISGGKTNIGITKFKFRQEFLRDNHYEIMLEVKNFSTTHATCPIRLSVDKTVIFNTSVRFEPFEKKSMIFPYSGLITGMAKAMLHIDDDFTVDNAAYLSLNTTQDIWVLLVSQGNYFLEKLLEAYPNFMVNTIRDIVPAAWEEQTMRHDIVIIDRTNFPLTSRGNFLLIDSFSPSLPVSDGGRIDFPEILDWDRHSPLMVNVNISGLAIEKAARLRANPALKPVIESSQTGLMYTFEKDAIRAVILGFDITRSDLPLKVAFPVMMSNIFNWLNPHKLHFSSLDARAGKPFDIFLNADTENISIRPPRSKWETYPVDSNPFTYMNTKKVGIYTISENNKRRRFTVNLLDELESDIAVPEIDKSVPKSNGSEKVATEHPLWPIFLLLGMGMLLIEWVVWLRTE